MAIAPIPQSSSFGARPTLLGRHGRVPAYFRGLGQDEYEYYYNGWSDGGADPYADPYAYDMYGGGEWLDESFFDPSAFDVSNLPLPSDFGPSVYDLSPESSYFDPFAFTDMYGGGEWLDDSYYFDQSVYEPFDYSEWLRAAEESEPRLPPVTLPPELLPPNFPSPYANMDLRSLYELGLLPPKQEESFWPKVGRFLKDMQVSAGSGVPSGSGSGAAKPQTQTSQQQQAAAKAAMAARPWLEQELISGLPNKWLLGIATGVILLPRLLPEGKRR